MDWNLEVPPLNPLDLRYKEFSRAMRGYSPEEVRNYLGELADKIGEILEENSRLRSELARLQKESTPDESEADLRDAIRSIDADLVLLQEVQGEHARKSQNAWVRTYGPRPSARLR